MLGRFATYVVPLLAVAVTATVLLGPGATRKAAFVRVYGTPTSSAQTLALRIEGAERLYGVDEKAAFENISVEATDADTPLEPVRLSLGADAIGEVLINAPRPLTGPISLRVTHGDHVLAHGNIDLHHAPPSERFVLSPLSLPGQTSGNLKMYVAVRRGALAAPLPDVLDIRVGLAEHVSPSNQGFDGIELEASAPGATIEPSKFVTDEHGAASIVVTPQAHHVELTITGKHPGHGDGRWEGTLPVIPGAIWMEPETKNGLVFVSQAPRDRVYVSAMNETGRIFGAIVPVSPDAHHMYRGRLDLPKHVQDVATHVVVAGDPQEQGAATVAWPLRSGEVARSLQLERLLDGAADAEQYERARASKARRAALWVVVAAMIFVVLLMLVQSRRAQRQLEANLGSAADDASSKGQDDRAQIVATARQESPVLRVALAVALVLLAFAMIGALSTLGW